MNSQSINTLGWEAFIFSAKAALAAALAYLAFSLLKIPGAPWATVSAVIVIQPALHPSLPAIWHRIIANLIGATVGTILASWWGPSIVTLSVGVLLTGLICQYSRLEEALRPALVAVVIVTLTKESTVWFGSLDRVVAVIIGCASALLVTLLFDRLLERWLLKFKKYIPIRGDSE